LATADGVHYSVRAYENPTPQQSLVDFVTEQTLPQGSKLVAKRSFKKDGVTRHEYRWLDKNKKERTEQFFATEQHLYHFLVDGASGDDPAVKEFFSSIVLSKNPEGIAIGDGPGLNGETIYAAKEVDKKARITKFFPPEYTEEARKAQITGTVFLKAVFSSNGQITGISVVSGLPFGLTERAIAAARKLQFVPAVKDGKNVSMWMQLEYNFNRY
jgi:TonB family protein